MVSWDWVPAPEQECGDLFSLACSQILRSLNPRGYQALQGLRQVWEFPLAVTVVFFLSPSALSLCMEPHQVYLFFF